MTTVVAAAAAAAAAAALVVLCRTYNQEVVRSTLGRVAIKWLLLRQVTVARQVNHLSINYHPPQLNLPSLWGR